MIIEGLGFFCLVDVPDSKKKALERVGPSLVQTEMRMDIEYV